MSDEADAFFKGVALGMFAMWIMWGITLI